MTPILNNSIHCMTV